MLINQWSFPSPLKKKNCDTILSTFLTEYKIKLTQLFKKLKYKSVGYNCLRIQFTVNVYYNIKLT